MKTRIKWPNAPPENLRKANDLANIKLALLAGRGITLTYDLFFKNDNDIRFHPIEKEDLSDDQALIAIWNDDTLSKYINYISDIF